GAAGDRGPADRGRLRLPTQRISSPRSCRSYSSPVAVRRRTRRCRRGRQPDLDSCPAVEGALEILEVVPTEMVEQGRLAAIDLRPGPQPAPTDAEPAERGPGAVVAEAVWIDRQLP